MLIWQKVFFTKPHFSRWFRCADSRITGQLLPMMSNPKRLQPSLPRIIANVCHNECTQSPGLIAMATTSSMSFRGARCACEVTLIHTTGSREAKWIITWFTTRLLWQEVTIGTSLKTHQGTVRRQHISSCFTHVAMFTNTQTSGSPIRIKSKHANLIRC